MRTQVDYTTPTTSTALSMQRSDSVEIMDKLGGRPFDAECAAVHGRETNSLVSEMHRLERGEELPEHLASRVLPSCKGARIFGPLYMADGSNVFSGENLVIYPQTDLGDNFLISLGNNVTIGSRVSISNIVHPLDPVQRVSNIVSCKPVIIGDNVTIGSGSVIVPGVTIGSNVAIEQNSVVSKDIPSDSIVGGKPARVLDSAFDLKSCPDSYHQFFNLKGSGPTLEMSQRTGLLLRLINTYDLEPESMEVCFRSLLGDDNFGQALICRPFYCEDGRNLTIRGPYTLINNGCVLKDGDPDAPISIGRGSFLGPRVTVHGGASIDKFCWLGANTNIGSRVQVGAGSVIAAGTRVPDDTIIPPHSLVMGDEGQVKRLIGHPRDYFELNGLLKSLVFKRVVERSLYLADPATK